MTTIKRIPPTAEDFVATAQAANEDVEAMKVGDFFKGALGYAEARGLTRENPLHGLYISCWITHFESFHGGLVWVNEAGIITGLGTVSE